MILDPTELFPEVGNLYEFPSVHWGMIYDHRRVDSYLRAIQETVRKGDVVVDVGTGTGLLAFLCLKAGAKRVHAIERSPIINRAVELAHENGFSDRIVFHNCDSRDAILPEGADVVVSELIGHLAFEEGMVESIFDAKRRMLRPGGRVLPQSVRLFAAPVEERHVYRSCIDGWVPVHGIDYSAMRKAALATSYITEIAESDLLAHSQPVFEVDFATETPPSSSCNRAFELFRNGTINGMAFWFDAQLGDKTFLSSGPSAKTHWAQCFAPIAEPFRVSRGQRIDVSMTLRLRQEQGASFGFSVEIQGGESAEETSPTTTR